jgi:putative addiction module killer protein
LIEIRRTSIYCDWFFKLKDLSAKARIASRISRLEEGNPGNFRSLGSDLMELKISAGPGYRVYFVQRGKTLILLLCGGDKSTQVKDIQRAKEMALQIPEEDM